MTSSASLGLPEQKNYENDIARKQVQIFLMILFSVIIYIALCLLLQEIKSTKKKSMVWFGAITFMSGL